MIQAILPSNRFKAVTKSDTVPLTYTCQSITGDPASPLVINRTKYLYVGGNGDVAVKNDADTSVTFVGVVAGTLLPIETNYFLSTGTSATNVVAIF